MMPHSPRLFPLTFAFLAALAAAAPARAVAQAGPGCGCPTAAGRRAHTGAGALGLAGIGLLGIGVGEVVPATLGSVVMTPVLTRLGAAAPALLPAFAPGVPEQPVTAFREGAVAPATASPLPLALAIAAGVVGAGWLVRRTRAAVQG